MSRRTQNGLVILTAAAASLALIDTQTAWLSAQSAQPERERCYGVVRAGRNDCATAKHSCAAQSDKARDAAEWIMLPKGLCDQLAGGVAEAL